MTNNTVPSLYPGNAFRVPVGPGYTLDVRRYGAAGDGVTDDTAAIQAALDDAKATGTPVEFPCLRTGPSRYLVTSTLDATATGYITRPLTLIGPGLSAATLVWGGSLNGTLLQSGVAEVPNGPLCVYGLGFDSLDDAHRAGSLINMTIVGQGEISQCQFDNCRDAITGSFILLFRIEKNLFKHSHRDCIAFDGSAGGQNNAIWIRQNEFGWYGRYGINLGGSGGNNANIIQNNSFEGSLAGSVASIYAYRSGRLNLLNNRFEDAFPSAGANFRSVILDDLQQAYISGNCFAEIGGDGTSDYSVKLVGSPSVTQGITFVCNFWASEMPQAPVDLDYTSAINVYGIANHHNNASLFGGAGAVRGREIADDSALLLSGDFRMLHSDEGGNVTGESVYVQKGKSFAVLAAAPAAGTWARGDVVWNSTPSAAGFAGWICTAAGTPGTWKGFGTIES